MVNRTRWFAALMTVSVAWSSVLPTAHAEPAPQDQPPPKKPKKTAAKPQPKPKPAAATAKDAPKPKPAGTSKEPAKRSVEAASSGGSAASHEVVEHESRIEFDERMVRGQSAAGAIFLFRRAPSDFKSIVDVPASFRPKTVELVERRGPF